MNEQREEFLAETAEIIEGFSRDLLSLDESLKKNQGFDPDTLNDAFRAVHTIKGLAGLFAVPSMSTMAHQLEDSLDDLRHGRIQLTARLLDVLFSSIDVFHAILAALRENKPEPEQLVDELLNNIGQASRPETPKSTSLSDYELDASLLSVLTEYEEHRLQTALKQGLFLYKIRARFDLSSIDTGLDGLKIKAKPHGEIITYLPSADSTDPDSIDLDILFASDESFEILRNLLTEPHIGLAQVPRRQSLNPDRSSMLSQHPTPPPPHPDFEVQVATDLHSSGAFRAMNGDDEAMSMPEVSTQQALSIRGVAQTVRVDIRKLDHLMNIVAELGIIKSTIGRLTDQLRSQPHMREMSSEMHRLNRSFDRHLANLQSGILEVRMVPLGLVFDKVARVVRQLGREQNKDIRLVITGGETEVDKLIVEELSDPLMHMIRNAIDHGIETKEARKSNGKPEAGTIAMNAYQKGNHVVIEVQDDGAGIDQERVTRQAIKRGLITEDEAKSLNTREVLGFIFIPGFSTKTDINELSGRGVGLDVVKTNIAKIGGVIDVQSELGIGTKMTITLPITLAIISALVVVIGGRRYAIPLSSVLEALLLDSAQVRIVQSREVMTLRGATLPLCRLAQLFALPSLTPERTIPRKYVVVVGVGSQRLGCVVDQLIGQQDIVIKALGESLKGVKGFSGATELGDQKVGLVIDAPAILEEVLLSGESARLLPNRRLHS